MKKFFGAAVLAAVFLALSILAPQSARASDTIADNVEIGKVDVSGMTSQEAKEAIAAYATEVGQRQITLRTRDKSITVSAADLGFRADAGDAVEYAVMYGRKGNLIERYADRQDIAKGKTKCLTLTTVADESKIRAFLTENESSLVTEPVDGTLERSGGSFTYIAGKSGHSLDIDASVTAILDYVSSGAYDTTDTVSLVTTEKKPRGTQEELSQVKDVLGTFSTNFSTSTAARSQNVKNGASKINGTLLYPGDDFSVARSLNPMTAENGYAPAPSYENGTTVDTYGGGVCQVSTTLYNALIRAEVKITNRSAHSMLVHYVDPSMDAAIAGFVKDLEFTNSLDSPIYIEGTTESGIITFTVYGKETRDPSRSIEFVSETTETIEAGTKLVADPTLPVGTVQKTKSGSEGRRAHLLKIVKINGVEESRTVFNNSSYAASDAVYTVGTKSDSSEAVSAMEKAIAAKDLEKVEAAAAEWKNAVSDKEEAAEEAASDEKPETDGDTKKDTTKKDTKKADREA